MKGELLGGVWYVSRRGFSLNEGGRVANLTVVWYAPFRSFVYVYLLGLRWSWHRKRRST